MVPLREADGHVAGVAAVDLTVDRVAQEWLRPDGLPPARAVLMDPAGRVLIDTANPRAAADQRPFEYPDVLADLTAGRAGGLRVVGDEVVAWTAVEQLGWTYGVVAPRSAVVSLLAE